MLGMDEDDKRIGSGVKYGEDKLKDAIVKSTMILKEIDKWKYMPYYVNYYQIDNPLVALGMPKNNKDE
jgi:hypothetical protein